MIINNLKIVTLNEVIENGYIEIKGSKIAHISKTPYKGNEKDIIDMKGKIAFPGFIDIHTHGSCGIDFMDAKVKDFKTIENAFYSEGITSFLATTLTSDHNSLKKVCENVKNAKNNSDALLGIHLEGPYINKIYKGAQNEEYIRKPSICELKELIDISQKNIRLITLAPEYDNSIDFIKYALDNGITLSAGHSNASFTDIENAIKVGLTNITHTHNAMSKHDHKNPGIVTAAFYFDELYTECIADGIHIHPNALKTFYKIVGPNRFMIVTDSLLGKHSKLDEFKLFNLDCVYKNGAFYLKDEGNLAGSCLYMNIGLKNMAKICGASLLELARISSYNQAKSLHLKDRGAISEGLNADIALLDDDFNVRKVYKLGKEVYSS